ncbi:MAG: hypothetical protein KF773_19165 [Deltaproteobacteria bacterium]|nr:hypothetical protein [Deltaproteobacteria bacterium]MCW5804924.1 hypothetical protein [Deltaproteobacteria bacterium]
MFARAAIAFSIFVASPAHAEPAPPYAPPFQLRPAVAASVLRADTSAALYEEGQTIVTSLIASYKLSPTVVPFARFAVLHDEPAMGTAATGTSNALAGLQWAPRIGRRWRASVIGAVTAPIGTGGGNAPDAGKAAANRAAIAARSSLDNTMFSPNDVALIAGASAAYVDRGLTLQAEVTVFELARVRGADVQPDRYKTNATSGLFAGYFLGAHVSLGAELRYQRYLSTPAFVANDATHTLRDQLTAAGGVRTHWQLASRRWLRPGVSYARALDAPMTSRSYQIVQIDLLFAY